MRDFSSQFPFRSRDPFKTDSNIDKIFQTWSSVILKETGEEAELRWNLFRKRVFFSSYSESKIRCELKEIFEEFAAF